MNNKENFTKKKKKVARYNNFYTDSKTNYGGRLVTNIDKPLSSYLNNKYCIKFQINNYTRIYVYLRVNCVSNETSSALKLRVFQLASTIITTSSAPLSVTVKMYSSHKN